MQSRNREDSGLAPVQLRKVFLGGLSKTTTDEDIAVRSTLSFPLPPRPQLTSPILLPQCGVQSYFSQFGKLVDWCHVTEGGAARTRRGFGFATFDSPNAAQSVLYSRYHPLCGRYIEVKPAFSRGAYAPEGEGFEAGAAVEPTHAALSAPDGSAAPHHCGAMPMMPMSQEYPGAGHSGMAQGPAMRFEDGSYAPATGCVGVRGTGAPGAWMAQAQVHDMSEMGGGAMGGAGSGWVAPTHTTHLGGMCGSERRWMPQYLTHAPYCAIAPHATGCGAGPAMSPHCGMAPQSAPPLWCGHSAAQHGPPYGSVVAYGSSGPYGPAAAMPYGPAAAMPYGPAAAAMPYGPAAAMPYGAAAAAMPYRAAAAAMPYGPAAAAMPSTGGVLYGEAAQASLQLASASPTAADSAPSSLPLPTTTAPVAAVPDRCRVTTARPQRHQRSSAAPPTLASPPRPLAEVVVTGAVDGDSPGADAPCLGDLPVELISEIAISTPLRALRSVVRFDVRCVAATRIQRAWRAWRLGAAGRDPKQLAVGDRVLMRRRVVGSNRNVCMIATAAVEVTRLRWKLRVLQTGAYIESHLKYLYRLEPWTDGPWAESVGRGAAVASALQARGAAIQAASAAIAAVRSADSSPATSALAVAAASAASSAAAAATAASTTVGPSDSCRRASGDISASRTLEAAQLLEVAQMVQEAAGSVAQAPAVDAPGSAAAGEAIVLLRHHLAESGEAVDSAAMLAEATTAAKEAALQGSAAASAAEAVKSVGDLRVTSGMAVVAAAAAGQVASAADALSCASSASAEHAATVAATGALVGVSAAGRRLARACADVGGTSLESQAAARALVTAQEAVAEAADVAAEMAAAAENEGAAAMACRLSEKKQ